MQYYVLIAANSGLRVGEQRQLRWSDVQIEQHKVNSEQQKLARINVRAETSKVRTSRTFLCRNGQYFERLREIAKPKTKTVTRTIAVPKTKIVKQQTPPQTTPKDIERTDFAPIPPQPPLPNQRNQ